MTEDDKLAQGLELSKEFTSITSMEDLIKFMED